MRCCRSLPTVYDRSRKVIAYSHANAICSQRNKSLGRAFEAFACTVLGIYLASNEEKIITDAMDHYSCYQHPVIAARVAVGKKNITQRPGKHTKGQHFF